MNVYLLDMGWRGGIVIKASSKKEAFEIYCKNCDWLGVVLETGETEDMFEEMTDSSYRFEGDE